MQENIDHIDRGCAAHSGFTCSADGMFRQEGQGFRLQVLGLRTSSFGFGVGGEGKRGRVWGLVLMAFVSGIGDGKSRFVDAVEVVRAL